MAQRDNMFDVAMRDIQSVRAAGQERFAARQEKHEHVGIGACGPGGCELGDMDVLDLNYLACYYTVLPQAALNVAAGTAFTLTFNSVDPFFDPRAISMVVRDVGDKGLPRVCNVGSVTIDGCRYEGTNVNPLTATSTQFWTSEKWDPSNRNGCACPVCWGLFTNSANGYPLVINGFNPNAFPIDVIAEVYGESLRCAPSWCDEKDSQTFRRKRIARGGGGAPSSNTSGAGRRGAYA